ncbi:MAG: DUF3499 family protein [Actinomycetota bacterium]
MSLCSKPGCPRAATAILGYDYEERLAILEDPTALEPSPHLYLLCTDCATNLRPPKGWTLRDGRTSPPLFLEGVRHRGPAGGASEAAEVDEAPAASVRQLFFGRSA